MENVILGGNVVSLPEELCENKLLFNEVVSFKTWNDELSNEQKQRLFNLLPNFPENDEKEKIETLKKLFGGENFKFGNQRDCLFKKINEGLLSPSIAKLSKTLKKAAYKEYRHQQQQYSCKLLKQIIHSRKLLLEAAQYAPPGGPIPRITDSSKDDKPSTGLEDRARWRYFSELQEIREECGELQTSSEDENYPGPPPKLSRKHKKHLQFLESSLSPDVHRISATTSPPTRIGHYSVSPRLAILDLSEDSYRAMLQEHQQRRSSGELHPDLDTSKVTLEGVMQRTSVARRPGKSSIKVGTNTNTSSSSKKKSKQKPSSLSQSQSHSQATTSQSKQSTPVEVPSHPVPVPDVKPPPPLPPPPEDPIIPEICPTPSPSLSLPTPTSSLPLEDPTLLTQASSSSDIPLEEMEVDVGSDVELYMPSRTTASSDSESVKHPSSFFTLIRDFFYELPEQKMTVSKLEDRVKSWMDNPVGNVEWFQLSDNWVELVSSALKFLAGDLLGIVPENFVPYLDYREKQQQWQWIGAGRDTDDHLNPLCQHWIENKEDLGGLESLDSCQGSPPPARVATDWTVKPTSEEEKSIYRHQENIRYQNPHKAFTFRIHGYESVVGPVKGVYLNTSQISSTPKAREHSLLVKDRPNFVTILSLVRDSAARLPNGEGTRADICELLKDSQYLSAATDQQVHTVVSGALDRLHYEKDPCVKYDTNRKLWIYLHRHRTEEEFEKIHQAQAAAAKAKKAMQKTKPARVKTKDGCWLSPTGNSTSSQGGAESSNSNLPDTSTSQTSPRPTSTSKSPSSSKGAQAVSSRRTSAQSQQQQSTTQTNQTTSSTSSSNTILPENSAKQREPSPSPQPQTNKNTAAVQMSSTATTNISNAGVLAVKSTVPPKTIATTVTQTISIKPEVIFSSTDSKLTEPTQSKSVTTSVATLITTLSTTNQPPPTTSVASLPTFVSQNQLLQSVSQAGQTLTGLLQQGNTSMANIQALQNKTQQAMLQCAAKRTNPSGGVQSFQTIVIKQDQVGKTSVPLLTAAGRAAAAGGANLSKPVVARLVSGTHQVVSLSNLMSGFGEVPVRFQGANYGQSGTSNINVLQSSTNTGSRLQTFALPNAQVGVGQLSSAGGIATRALVVDQEKQALFTTAGGTLKLVANPTTLQQLPPGLKVQQAVGANKSVASTLTTGTNVVMTTTGSLTSMLLAGSNPVMIASQSTLKPTTQTYVMAATGTSPQTVRAMKTLQGIKVIPVSQAVGTLRGANKTQQPLVARIITPSTGITLQPAHGSSAAAAVGLVQSLSNVAGVQKGGIGSSKPATISLTTAAGQQPVIIQMHTSELTTPQSSATNVVTKSEEEAKKS